MTNEFILFDRIEKIKDTINKYGEENFHIAYSGGKDSTVLSFMVDLAVPHNKIPRVFANTGIEYNKIIEYVHNNMIIDKRIIEIKPSQNIKSMLEEYGYPFKSKLHSSYVANYQQNGFKYKITRAYTLQENTTLGKPMSRPCPKKLIYQFTPQCKLKISDLCCKKLKTEPCEKWANENKRPIAIIGLRSEEGGRRKNANCLGFRGKKLIKFQPLVPITEEFMDWFISKYNIELCELYTKYGFKRTGCKGCPFNIKIQDELNILEKYFPDERKQCEIIWKPVYDEYRRLNYRLKEGD